MIMITLQNITPSILWIDLKNYIAFIFIFIKNIFLLVFWDDNQENRGAEYLHVVLENLWLD